MARSVMVEGVAAAVVVVLVLIVVVGDEVELEVGQLQPRDGQRRRQVGDLRRRRHLWDGERPESVVIVLAALRRLRPLLASPVAPSASPAASSLSSAAAAALVVG